MDVELSKVEQKMLFTLVNQDIGITMDDNDENQNCHIIIDAVLQYYNVVFKNQEQRIDQNQKINNSKAEKSIVDG